MQLMSNENEYANFLCGQNVMYESKIYYKKLFRLVSCQNSNSIYQKHFFLRDSVTFHDSAKLLYLFSNNSIFSNRQENFRIVM